MGHAGETNRCSWSRSASSRTLQPQWCQSHWLPTNTQQEEGWVQVLQSWYPSSFSQAVDYWNIGLWAWLETYNAEREGGIWKCKLTGGLYIGNSGQTVGAEWPYFLRLWAKVDEEKMYSFWHESLISWLWFIPRFYLSSFFFLNSTSSRCRISALAEANMVM